MVLEVNGVVASIGAGAACLDHPLNACAWLARTLAGTGEGLKEGDVVLTGALGPMVALSPGMRVTANIGGLGATSFTFPGDG
jgi:2-keto-4-pentenoate hydratase